MHHTFSVPRIQYIVRNIITEVYVTVNNERHNFGYPSSIFLAVDYRLQAVAKLFVTGIFCFHN